jgi:hypothetical protein
MGTSREANMRRLLLPPLRCNTSQIRKGCRLRSSLYTLFFCRVSGWQERRREVDSGQVGLAEVGLSQNCNAHVGAEEFSSVDVRVPKISIP